MNILHHKSWHVRNKDNIAKVRRDQQKAADDEAETTRRSQLAEREAKIQFLRRRARQDGGAGYEDHDEDDEATEKEGRYGVGGIFQSSVGEDIGDVRVNAEHEKEKKLETEAWEKKIGLLTYLGQSELAAEQPWYLKPYEERLLTKEPDPKETFNHSGKYGASSSTGDSSAKKMHDPLVAMQGYLQVMAKNKAVKDVQKGKSDALAKEKMRGKLAKGRSETEDGEGSRRRSNKHKKLKKEKKKHTKKDKKSKSKSRSRKKSHEESTDSSSGDELEKAKKRKKEALREERLKRERAEHDREKFLIMQSKGLLDPDASDSTRRTNVDERFRNYNTQFNPHLSKQF